MKFEHQRFFVIMGLMALAGLTSVIHGCLGRSASTPLPPPITKDITLTTSSSSLGVTDAYLTISPPFTTSLSFSCQDGYVRLNFETGAVEFVKCDPPEAAKAFWRAVSEAYPEVRQAMIKGE